VEISQEDYGHLLGATRQRINQLIKQWCANGWVETRYRHLIIRDEAALRALAGRLNSPVMSFMQPSLVPLVPLAPKMPLGSTSPA
jgi:hypothetical protein